MQFLIDGHNLIPKVPGLSLKDPDDEEKLVGLLQVYCRVKRQKVEVYFDGATPGSSSKKTHGQIVAHYVRKGRTADQAMIERMHKIGRQGSNWTVVSSDHQVIREARDMRFHLVSSEVFARNLLNAWQENEQNGGHNDDRPDDKEIEEWLRLFGKDH
jgi:uncharacterized protein